MEVTIIGNRIRLKNLQPGSVAVDGKGKTYTRVHVPDPKESRTMLIQLNDLSNQYNDMIHEDTMVRELISGEQVVMTI